MAVQTHEQGAKNNNSLIEVAIRRLGLVHELSRLAMSEGDDGALLLVQALQEAAGGKENLPSVTSRSHEDALIAVELGGAVAVVPSSISLMALTQRRRHGRVIAGPLQLHGSEESYSLVAPLEDI